MVTKARRTPIGRYPACSAPPPCGAPACRLRPAQREASRSAPLAVSSSRLVRAALLVGVLVVGSIDVSGAAGAVAVSNAHGTVTGAAGGVLLRPFARLTSKDGDSVTTYGEPWDMK